MLAGSIIVGWLIVGLLVILEAYTLGGGVTAGIAAVMIFALLGVLALRFDFAICRLEYADTALRTALVNFGWFIAGLLLMALFCTLWGVGGAALSLPFALALLCLTGLRIALAGYRRHRADMVLGHVATAIDLGLPLPDYLRIASQSSTPSVARRLLRMSSAIESGIPLPRAISIAAGELPLVLQDQIAAAERSGTLPQTLPTLLAQEQRRTAVAVRARADVAYAFVLATMVVIIVTMISIFVLPKFAQILHDFHLPMSPATVALGRASRIPDAIAYVIFYPFTFVFTDTWEWLQFIVFMPIVMLILFTIGFVASAARGLFTSRSKRSIFRVLTDPVVWRTPVFGRLVRQRQSAAICETLHDALQAGRPLPEAISLATFPSLNLVLRKRMTRWQQRVTAGESAATAARASKLPRLLCDLLAGARNDVPGAIAFAGRAYASASERLAIVLRAVAPILVTFTFALIVLSLALSLFAPMLTMIDALAIRSRP